MNFEKELKLVKLSIFTHHNSAFIASIMCQVEFKKSTQINTAATNGKELLLNEDWWMSLPARRVRTAIVLHELWHIGRLHALRKGNRDMVRWNKACDHVINLALIKEGFQLPEGLANPDFEGMAEEAVYDALPAEPDDSDLDIDILESVLDKSSQLQIVLQAQQASKGTSKTAGTMPGSIQSILDSFLKPKVPWNLYLRKYFTDLGEPGESTWRRPNRRFTDIYLPSYDPSQGRLTSLAYFIDTSGSISDNDIKQINSELKYIKEKINPKRLEVIQFDTEIHSIKVFTENTPYRKIEIKGRGGTSYEPVYDYIVKHKPVCSIIFTDLYCEVMKDPKLPVIWVCTEEKPPYIPDFGKLLIMREPT